MTPLRAGLTALAIAIALCAPFLVAWWWIGTH